VFCTADTSFAALLFMFKAASLTHIRIQTN